jgi:hypothetical protein
LATCSVEKQNQLSIDVLFGKLRLN